MESEPDVTVETSGSLWPVASYIGVCATVDALLWWGQSQLDGRWEAVVTVLAILLAAAIVLYSAVMAAFALIFASMGRSGSRHPDDVPKSRRIPGHFELISWDGWTVGDVALIRVGTFMPAHDVVDLLEPTLLSDDYRRLPIWIRVSDSHRPPDVMSGNDPIGHIPADREYLELIVAAQKKLPGLVPDGDVLVRREGEHLHFSKLRVHVMTSLREEPAT